MYIKSYYVHNKQIYFKTIQSKNQNNLILDKCLFKAIDNDNQTT